jgi:hypothetical protein
MAKKLCPIRQNVCETVKCMFWEDVDDPDTDGCLIVSFFCNFNALNFENLDSLVKLAGKNLTR